MHRREYSAYKNPGPIVSTISRHCLTPEFPTRFCRKALQKSAAAIVEHLGKGSGPQD